MHLEFWLAFTWINFPADLPERPCLRVQFGVSMAPLGWQDISSATQRPPLTVLSPLSSSQIHVESMLKAWLVIAMPHGTHHVDQGVATHMVTVGGNICTWGGTPSSQGFHAVMRPLICSWIAGHQLLTYFMSNQGFIFATQLPLTFVSALQGRHLLAPPTSACPTGMTNAKQWLGSNVNSSSLVQTYDLVLACTAYQVGWRLLLWLINMHCSKSTQNCASL